MSDKQVRMIQAAHRAVVPRQVQKLLDYRESKRPDGTGPSFAKRQVSIRRVLLWALGADSVQALSRRVLDSSQQADVEQTHRAFALAAIYMEEGELQGQLADQDLRGVRQVLDYWDYGMNREDDLHRDESERAGVEALPPDHLGGLPELRKVE